MQQITRASLSGAFTRSRFNRVEREPLLLSQLAQAADADRGDEIQRCFLGREAGGATPIHSTIVSDDGSVSLNIRDLYDLDRHMKGGVEGKQMGVTIPLKPVADRNDELRTGEIRRLFNFSEFCVNNMLPNHEKPSLFTLKHITGMQFDARTESVLFPSSNKSIEVRKKLLNLIPKQPMTAREWHIVLKKLCDNLQLASIPINKRVYTIGFRATCLGSSRTNWHIRSTFRKLGWTPGNYSGPNKPQDVESLPGMICPLNPDKSVWVTYQNGMASSEIQLHLAMGNPNLADLTYYRRLIHEAFS